MLGGEFDFATRAESRHRNQFARAGAEQFAGGASGQQAVIDPLRCAIMAGSTALAVTGRLDRWRSGSPT